MNSYLAFDLGADSGRAVIGNLDDSGRLQICEVHRFPNKVINEAGRLYWDIDELYKEIIRALQLCSRQQGVVLASIGVDTWGVDFSLLDGKGKPIGKPLTYRNFSAASGMTNFLKMMPRKKLYTLTGIQLLPYNSVFQLYSMAYQANSLLSKANSLLFMPDLFTYKLTEQKSTEFTIATTSQLYNPRSLTWDKSIFEAAGIPEGIMQKVVNPGTVVGDSLPEITKLTGLKSLPVVAVGSHDTASAVAAVPAWDDNFAFISCGTWSLMGVISPEPAIDNLTFKYNITNEGGVGDTFRILKNISGLWLLQRCRQEWAKTKEYAYDDLVHMAKTAACDSVIDPDSGEFFNPVDMPAAIKEFCVQTEQSVPSEVGQFVRVIITSLALAYRRTLEYLRKISPHPINRIHIIGGGSQNELLCQYTANATGMLVYAGPIEATAIGNLLVQAKSAGELVSFRQIGEIVKVSFNVVEYESREADKWEFLYDRFIGVLKT